MQTIAFLMLCAGFVVAAYATALDVDHVNWLLFSAAAITAIAGVIMQKRLTRAAATSGDVLDLNRRELRESLDNIVRDLGELDAAVAMDGDGLRNAIDDRITPDMRRFADARESMVHLFGLQAYADIMSQFAAGERYVNRVWSSSADGYDEEARACLKKAMAQFVTARDQLNDAMRRRETA